MEPASKCTDSQYIALRSIALREKRPMVFQKRGKIWTKRGQGKGGKMLKGSNDFVNEVLFKFAGSCFMYI